MAFVLTQRIPAAPGATIWDAGRRVAVRLQRIGRRSGSGGMTPQQRVEHYVSLMPVGVLGR